MSTQSIDCFSDLSGFPCLDVVVSLYDSLFRELDDWLENRGFNFTGLDRLGDIRTAVKTNNARKFDRRMP
jgi:hypothetical protein